MRNTMTIKEFLLLVLAMCIMAVAIIAAFTAVWYWGQVIGMLFMGELV